MRFAALSASIILSGCQDYDIRANNPAPGAGPDIEVTPEALSFGPARSGEQVVHSFLVRNVGTEALDVSSVEISVGELAFSITSDTTFELLPDEERSVEVAFVPVGNLTYGEVLIASDDPDEAQVTVALEGLGEVPALTITPEAHVFPSICPEQVVLTLENTGLADLQITELRYDTANPDLSLDHQLTLPLTLEPAQSVGVTVHYEPSGSASTGLGQLQVDSNDPRGTRTADQQSEASGDLVSEIFEVLEDPPADILFAIDKSGSMSEEAWNLGRAFDDFITDIGNVTTDWRIGVVTKDTGCFNRGIITAATPDYEAVFLDAVTGIQFFGTDLTEALLELVDNSLQQTAVGGCNAGFIRGNAMLHVIIVSDEPEQSGQPWDHWITRWQDRMSDPNLVLVSSVVDDDVSGDCGQYGEEYIPAAQGTGGVVLDVCDSSWGSHASQLGSATAGSLNTFLLSALPDPATIAVSVDGVAYTSGWSYDAIRNAVTITAALPAGSEVEVSYVAVGC